MGNVEFCFCTQAICSDTRKRLKVNYALTYYYRKYPIREYKMYAMIRFPLYTLEKLLRIAFTAIQSSDLFDSLESEVLGSRHEHACEA